MEAVINDMSHDHALRIEGRRDAQDRVDRSSIQNHDRATGRATSYVFVDKRASPLLWVSDATAGMASAYFASAKGSDHWWRNVRPARLMISHLG